MTDRIDRIERPQPSPRTAGRRKKAHPARVARTVSTGAAVCVTSGIVALLGLTETTQVAQAAPTLSPTSGPTSGPTSAPTTGSTLDTTDPFVGPSTSVPASLQNAGLQTPPPQIVIIRRVHIVPPDDPRVGTTVGFGTGMTAPDVAPVFAPQASTRQQTNSSSATATAKRNTKSAAKSTAKASIKSSTKSTAKASSKSKPKVAPRRRVVQAPTRAS